MPLHSSPEWKVSPQGTHPRYSEPFVRAGDSLNCATTPRLAIPALAQPHILKARPTRGHRSINPRV